MFLAGNAVAAVWIVMGLSGLARTELDRSRGKGAGHLLDHDQRPVRVDLLRGLTRIRLVRLHRPGGSSLPLRPPSQGLLDLRARDLISRFGQVDAVGGEGGFQLAIFVGEQRVQVQVLVAEFLGQSLEAPIELLDGRVAWRRPAGRQQRLDADPDRWRRSRIRWRISR